MAVTAISITQDNKSNGCDLLSIHNPLVFLIEVDYESEVPETLLMELQDEDGEILETFAAIPYKDSSSGNTRTFAFTASNVLNAYMDDFEDFESPERTLEYVENITQVFTIRAYVDGEAYEDSVTFTAIHAVRQFGDTPYLESIYDNEDETYYAGVGMPVYVYFYNADEGNILTIDAESADEMLALDYDDTAFVDSDDQNFKTL